MNYCVGKHFANARASVKNRSLMVLGILCSGEKKLHEIVSGQDVFGDILLGIGCFTPSCEVLMLPWIAAAPYGDASALPASDEIKATSLLHAKRIQRLSLSGGPGFVRRSRCRLGPMLLGRTQTKYPSLI